MTVIADRHPDRVPPSIANRDGLAEFDERPDMMSLGAEFEEKLEAAKREAAPAPVTTCWSADADDLDYDDGEDGALV
ncbi:hypothetical protein ACFSC3_07765 [Sphingomonas floccifaciens]|uniref:Uncharacterized protein n=1 Tax=Sphingomonas floccifaciens TaxID=1844115 RepID=A0ABW4NBQ5_9SPHN